MSQNGGFGAPEMSFSQYIHAFRHFSGSKRSQKIFKISLFEVNTCIQALFEVTIVPKWSFWSTRSVILEVNTWIHALFEVKMESKWSFWSTQNIIFGTYKCNQALFEVKMESKMIQKLVLLRGRTTYSRVGLLCIIIS